MARTIVAKCPWCHGSGQHPCLKDQPCRHAGGPPEREMNEAELLGVLKEGHWREKMWAHAAVVAMARANRDVSHLLDATIATCTDADFSARGTAVRAAGILAAYCHPMAAQLEAAVLAAHDDAYFGVRAVAVAADFEIQSCKGAGAIADISDSHVARVLSACRDLDVDVRCAGAASARKLREMGCRSEDLETVARNGLTDSSKTARAAFHAAWTAFSSTGAKSPEPMPPAELPKKQATVAEQEVQATRPSPAMVAGNETQVPAAAVHAGAAPQVPAASAPAGASPQVPTTQVPAAAAHAGAGTQGPAAAAQAGAALAA